MKAEQEAQKNGSPSSAVVDRECFSLNVVGKAKKALGKWKGIPAPLSNPTHVYELHTEHVPTAAHRIEFEFLKSFGGLYISHPRLGLSPASRRPPPPESHGMEKEKGEEERALLAGEWKRDFHISILAETLVAIHPFFGLRTAGKPTVTAFGSSLPSLQSSIPPHHIPPQPHETEAFPLYSTV